MGHYNQNGSRNATSDENRPSWRPQDQSSAAPRPRGNEDDHDYDSWRDRNQDRSTGDRDPSRWEGSRGSELGHAENRDAGRSTERYGQGQSGYSAGRYGDDGSQHMQNRNDMVRSSGNREDRGLGVDDRFTGRGEDRGSERHGDSDRDAGRDADRGGSWRAYDQPQGTRSNRMMGGTDRDPGHRSGGQDHWRGYPSSGGREPMGYQGSGRPGESMDYRRASGPGYGDQSRNQGYDGGRGYGQGYDGGRGYGQGDQASGHGYGNQGGAGYRGSQLDDASHGTQDDPQRMGSMSPHAPRPAGPHRGKGPQGYKRSDERIREAVCEVLADDEHIDASQIHVEVKDGEVTLSGTVDDRRIRREAEDCVSRVSGVRDVLVQLRVRDERQGGQGMQRQGDHDQGGPRQVSQHTTGQSLTGQSGQSLSTQTGASSADSLANTGKSTQASSTSPGKHDAETSPDKKARS
ncbi:MAG: BON domain-containing protein [Myxococcales bacterium]|nr:BON domain-containing protein [Myxococcales bacterium]